MKHSHLISVVAVALLAACSTSGRKGGEVHPDECQAIGDQTAANAIAQIPRGTDPAMRERLENLSRETGHIIAVRCVAEGWSAEAVKCGLAAKDPQLECRDKLTAAQLKRMSDEVQETWTKGLTGAFAGPAAGSAAPPTPTPPPAP